MTKFFIRTLLMNIATVCSGVFASQTKQPTFVFSAVFWEKYKSESFTYSPWGNDSDQNATKVDISVGSSALSRKFVFYGKKKLSLFQKRRPREWEADDLNSSEIEDKQPLSAEFQLPQFKEGTQEIVLLFVNKKKNGLWKIYPIDFSLKSIPFGNYKFVSQSKKSLYLLLGENKITLESGQSQVASASLKPDQNTISLQVMVQQGGRYRELIDQKYRHSPNMRGLFFLATNNDKLTIKKLIEFKRPLSSASGYGVQALKATSLRVDEKVGLN